MIKQYSVHGKGQDRWMYAIALCLTGFTRLSHRCFQLESFLMSTYIPAPIFSTFLFSFRKGHTQKQETGNLTIAKKYW